MWFVELLHISVPLFITFFPHLNPYHTFLLHFLSHILLHLPPTFISKRDISLRISWYFVMRTFCINFLSTVIFHFETYGNSCILHLNVLKISKWSDISNYSVFVIFLFFNNYNIWCLSTWLIRYLVLYASTWIKVRCFG